MPPLLDQVMDVDVEVRNRAEVLSTTTSVAHQKPSYGLLQPAIEANRSLSPPSRGLRTSATPPLFPTSQALLSEADGSNPLQTSNYIHIMPSLPTSGLDDEFFDDTISAGIDGAFPLCSAEREPFTTDPTSIESTPANEVQLSIEQKQGYDEGDDDEDEEEEESTLYEDILLDAKAYFQDEKPDFVIKATLDTSRIVDMGEGQTREMTLEAWGGEQQGQAFWVLEDNYGEKHIVKFFNKGKCYKAWRGAEEGFDEEPIAWPEKTRKSTGSSTLEDDASFIEINEDSDDGHGHSLRKRTWTQEYPYKADKEMHAATKAGKVKRKSEIDAREARRDENILKRASASMTTATPRQTSRAAQKKQRRSRSSTTISEAELSPEECRQQVKANTTFLTMLPPVDEPLPIFLSDCPDVTTLWDKTVSMWSSDINGTVKEMSIRFPWLGHEYNIKLKAGLAGPYNKMIQEIHDAPCWKDGTNKCSVEIVLVIA